MVALDSHVIAFGRCPVYIAMPKVGRQRVRSEGCIRRIHTAPHFCGFVKKHVTKIPGLVVMF
jgi:hypothetical protein